VQGPPGAGKTYTGARMTCAPAKHGRSIGVTANGDKVIRNLLDEVVIAARSQGISIRCIQKVSGKEGDRSPIRFTNDKVNFLDALHSDCKVGGPTAWFWVRTDAESSVDVLFIDEAVQMSLANVLAVSQAAKSIVLRGDPRQLEQGSRLESAAAKHRQDEDDDGLPLVLFGKRPTWTFHSTPRA
jgi:hypothetical protein